MCYLAEPSKTGVQLESKLKFHYVLQKRNSLRQHVHRNARIYAFMVRASTARQLKESHRLHLAPPVTRIERIETSLESIEENNKDIKGKICNLDSRFDDVDSKVEHIDMDALMGSINEAIRESLDEWLDFKAVARMAAMVCPC